jgi:DNA repair photolyase
LQLPLFNSTKAGLCTCLPKYNLNTYLGRCSHNCLYCYAEKFPSFRGPAQPRLRLLEQIEKMAEQTKHKLPVMMSDCTDPYQPLEAEHKITRKCAEVLAKHGFPLLIVTKSSLVTRDADIFKRTPTVVSVSITTRSEEIAQLIEPFASAPEKRLSALQKIADEGITTVARIDPILPTINDSPKDFEKLVSTLAAIGVKQVTMATMKHLRGFLPKLKQISPDACLRLTREYVDGMWAVGYKYLPAAKRKKIAETLRPIVQKHGLAFASCREGFPEYSTALCDGTSYCRRLLDTHLAA